MGRRSGRLGAASLAAALLAGLTVVVAVPGPAAAYPVDAEISSCQRQSVYWDLVHSENWSSSAATGMRLAMAVIPTYSTVFGTPHLGSQARNPSDPWPGPSATTCRLRITNNPMPYFDASFALCKHLFFMADDIECMISIGPPWTTSSNFPLYLHEVGHVQGLGHTGFTDDVHTFRTLMQPGSCGVSSAYSPNPYFSSDEYAALEYANETNAGQDNALNDFNLANANPGFENEVIANVAAGWHVLRSNGTTYDVSSLQLPYPPLYGFDSGYAAMAPGDVMYQATRIANMNELNDGNAPGNQFKFNINMGFRSGPATSVGDVYFGMYTRTVSYTGSVDSSCDWPTTYISAVDCCGDQDDKNYNFISSTSQYVMRMMESRSSAINTPNVWHVMGYYDGTPPPTHYTYTTYAQDFMLNISRVPGTDGATPGLFFENVALMISAW